MPAPLKNNKSHLRVLWLYALAALFFFSQQVMAEPAGHVNMTQRLVWLQKPDGTIRPAQRGTEFEAGDIVSTGRDSTARLFFSDGGELTLRPDSQVRIEQYTYRVESAELDNALLRLVKGGLRAVTGLIGKRGNRDAYRVGAETATIGIRGTDFTARLCGTDCEEESKKLPPDRNAVPPPAARIALAQGRVTATDTRGVVRDLETKSAVYVGDTVRTASDGYAFLVFRDEGRMTLAANSSFTIEQFRYEQARPEQNSIVVRLLQGGLRSLTGLIATRRPESFKLHTVVATIGVRGSGIDVRCGHLCVDPLRFAPDSRTFVRGQAGGATGEQGMPNAGGSTVPRVGDPIGTALTMSTEQRVEFTVSVWDGTATACPAAAGPAACRDVPKDQTAIIEKTDEPPKVVSNAPPLFDESAPRPDKPDVNMKDLFPEAKSDPGLYVYVREGKVVVSDSGKDVIAEAGEGIYADGRGGVPIPVLPPKSLQYDPWLLRTSNICR